MSLVTLPSPSPKSKRWQDAAGEIFERMRIANGDSPESLCEKLQQITNPNRMTTDTYNRCEKGWSVPYIIYLRVAEEIVRITKAKSQPEDDPRRQGYEELKQILPRHAPKGNDKIDKKLQTLFS